VLNLIEPANQIQHSALLRRRPESSSLTNSREAELHLGFVRFSDILLLNSGLRRITRDLPALVPFSVCWLSRMAINSGLGFSP